jgi:hypothetical protein
MTAPLNPDLRVSIAPTYDHQKTGDRFTVESRLNGQRLTYEPMPDPFVFHRVVVGWRDLLRGLFRRRVEVEVIVGGDREIVEDVCELDSDYLGRPGSSRRREWDQHLDRRLREFAGSAESDEKGPTDG